MTRLLHLSDPHFGTERPEVVEALLRFAADQRPDLALLTGDITQRATRQQFRQARDFADQLPCPTLSVPGNHDLPLFNLPRRLLAPYAHYLDYFSNELEPLYETRDLLIVGVNSTAPGRHKNGELKTEQVTRVSALLRQADSQQLRIVMQHHPVHAIEPSDRANLLIGHETVVPQWVDAGLDLLLAGHIHLPYVRPLAGATRSRQAWTAQAGTALSSRVRGDIPNSVNLIEHLIDGPFQRCTIERWDYAETSRSFRLYSQADLALDRNA
ncbi:MAG: metallophosphoesterase [Pseudomonadaceae bacterium]